MKPAQTQHMDRRVRAELGRDAEETDTRKDTVTGEAALASVSTLFQPGPGVTLSQGSAHVSQHLPEAQHLVEHTEAAAPMTQVAQQLSRGHPGILISSPSEGKEHETSRTLTAFRTPPQERQGSCSADLKLTPPPLSAHQSIGHSLAVLAGLWKGARTALQVPGRLLSS